jgi:hypothetical protein
MHVYIMEQYPHVTKLIKQHVSQTYPEQCEVNSK